MISSSSDTLTVGIILLLLFGAICFYLYSRIIQGEKKISLLENILLDLKVATESSMLNIPDQTETLYNSLNHIGGHSTPLMTSGKSVNDIDDTDNTDDIDDTDDILESMEYHVMEETSSSSRKSTQNNEEDIVKRIIEENNEPLPTPLPIGTQVDEKQVDEKQVDEKQVDEKQIEINGSSSDNEENTLFVNKVESAYDHMTVKELQAVAKSKGLSVSGMKRAQVIEALKAYDNAPASIASSEPMSFEEAFNSGEGGEPVPMDAPGTLMEANFIE